MEIELTKLEKVTLEALLEYQLDITGEELKNTPYNTYYVLKDILNKLYKIEEQDKLIIKGDDNEIKYKILALAMIIVSNELDEEEDANKGISLFECLNTLNIIQDKYKLNKEV